jgi:hypothetical protein
MPLPIDIPAFCKAAAIGLAGYVTVKKVVAAIPSPDEILMQSLMGALDPKALPSS